MTYSQCKDYIRSDYFSIKGELTNSIVRLFSATFLDISLRFLFWFRLAKCDNKLIQWPARLEPCVVNSSVHIGDNDNLGQFTTIGSLYYHAATIDNEVCTLDRLYASWKKFILVKE